MVELTNENAHLAVVQHAETLKFHGAVYQNMPKPSGLERWILRLSTVESYDTELEAAQAINKQFPHLEQLCLSSLQLSA